MTPQLEQTVLKTMIEPTVRAMTEMGHGLDLIVTAEGVETEAERETITRLGCDVMQGYLASRPLHGEKLLAWFDALPSASAA